MSISKNYKPINFFSTALNGAINSSITTCVVNAAPSFSGNTGYVILDQANTSLREICEVTNVSGTTLTIVRGSDGTSGQAHSSGATVDCLPNAAYLADFIDSYAVEHNTSGTHKAITSTNATLTTPTISSPTISGTVTGQVIGGTNLTTSAITLGYAQITANQTGIGAQTDVTGLTTTVSVPVGGRQVKITAFAGCSNGTANQNVATYIMEGATQLQTAFTDLPSTTFGATLIAVAVVTPSSGSHTYKVQALGGANTGNILASATAPAFILVEAI